MVSFVRIAKLLHDIGYQSQLVPAHDFLETLLSRFTSTVTWYQRFRFRVAVSQFCTPMVSDIIPGLQDGFHIGTPIAIENDMFYYLGVPGAPNPLAVQEPAHPQPEQPQQPEHHMQGPVLRLIPAMTDDQLLAIQGSLAQERWDGVPGAESSGDDNDTTGGGGPATGVFKAYNKTKDNVKRLLPKTYDPDRPTKKIKTHGQFGQATQTASSSKTSKQKSKKSKPRSSVIPPDETLDTDLMPTKIKFQVFDQDQNRHVPMSFKQNSRKITTMQAGLYSSVLGAAKFWNDVHRESLSGGQHITEQQSDAYAIAEAELWQKLISSIAKDMSYARFVALHILNIAQHVAYHSLDNETMLDFFRVFFTSDISELRSLWRFILYCGMDYQPATRGATKAEIRESQQHPYSDDITILAMDGSLLGDERINLHNLKAFEGDIVYLHLSKLMKVNPVIRNVFLLARKHWYLDCHEEMINRAPASVYRSQLLDVMVTNLINVYQLNVVKNFHWRYCRFIERLLKETARVPIGWPSNDDFIQQITNHVIQGGNTNFIDEIDGFATDGAREDAKQFVQQLIDRRSTSDPTSQDHVFNIHKCTQELINKATIPDQWPGPKDALVGYLFYRIWGVSLRSMEDAEDEAEEEEQIHNRVQQLPEAIRNDIDNFVQTQRGVQVAGIPIADTNIHVLLGVTGQPVELQTDEGELYTAGVSQHPREGMDHVDDDQEEEDEEYIGDITACSEDTGWLVPVMIHMLESCPEGLSFGVSPLAANHTIAIPFTVGALTDILNHMGYFTDPLINPFNIIADDNTKPDVERNQARQSM